MGQSLILVNDASPTPDLVQVLLHSTLKHQRKYAAQILGERKEPAALPSLLQALEDPEDVVQKAVAEAIVKVGDKRTYPQLIDNLSAQKPSVRQYSAYVLGQLASKEDLAVIDALEHHAEDSKNAVRLEIIYALYEIGSASSVPIFVNGLKDGEPRIRSYCANALGNLKLSDASRALSSALDTEQDESVRRSIISALGKIGGRVSAQTLAEAVTNETPSLRADIADALGEMKTPEATRALIELLSDSNVKVRAKAAAALANVKEPTSVGPLAKALKDNSVLVRRPASAALARVADSSVTKELVEALGDIDPEVANNAVRALIQVNDLEAVHPLINALAEENKKTRALIVLQELTHRPYGSDLAKWIQWYEENFKAGVGQETATPDESESASDEKALESAE
jgi:HEAT repeat protein